MAHSRDVHVLEFCGRYYGTGTRCDRSYIVCIVDMHDSRPRVEQASGRINLPAR